MMPLSDAERAAVLAAHPGATEEDLDRFLGLMARRFQHPPDEAPARGRRAAAAPRAAEDEELDAMARDVFPNMTEAIARAREEGGAA